MPRPIAIPSCGFAPYAPEPMTPEISTTPSSMIGSATSTSRRGRSLHRNHAANAMITTCRLPRTELSPAPIRSTA